MRITVDEKTVEVAEGRTILQALDDAGLLMNGIDIPHYCWHPKLSIDGSCRLCKVEVEGMRALQIACGTQVADGMVVHTDSPRVRRAREAVMELLLVNHPLDCPICDQAGECGLQDYAFEYGAVGARTREPRRALKKNTPLGTTVVLDQERCILCRRCVRFLDEVTDTRELGVFNRGDASVVDCLPGAPLDNDYSMNVADICPVGALTTRDFRFKVRVWFLEELEGICSGCSRGCNVYAGVSNNEVQRYVPRRNDAVNDTWMCDAGRLSYRAIGAPDRLDHASVRDAAGRLVPASIDAAVEEAARRLRAVLDEAGGGAIAGVASAHATNEDLATFRDFLAAVGCEAFGVAVVRGESDDLLICEEKAANASGARSLGFANAAVVVDAIASGRVKALLALGHDLLADGYLGDVTDLAGLDAVVAIDLRHSPLQRLAHVVIPCLHAAEKSGSVTNVDGRVQRLQPLVKPVFEAQADGELLARLGAAMALPGFDGSPWCVRSVSRELADRESAFSGADLDSLGSGGVNPVGAESG